MLAAGTGAQAGFSTITFAVAVMAPDLRDLYDLSLTEIGVVLAAEWIGLTVAMLPWGFAADRYGERATLAVGLVACSGFLAAAAFAPDYRSLVVLLALAGVAGGSVQSGSGRAVMRWFGAHERGLALGVRQTAVPIGGFIAALVLPLLDGPRQGFLFLAGFVLAGAVAGAVVLRSRPESELPETTEVEATLGDTPLAAPLRHQRRLRRRPGRPDGVHRPLPARGARSLDRSGGRRSRRFSGRCGRPANRRRPLVRRHRLPDAAAAGTSGSR